MSSKNGHHYHHHIGDRVKVLTHKHPDVIAGTEGVIDCHYEGGYGVSITGHWLIAGGDRGQGYDGTEIVWYEPKEIQAV